MIVGSHTTIDRTWKMCEKKGGGGSSLIGKQKQNRGMKWVFDHEISQVTFQIFHLTNSNQFMRFFRKNERLHAK